MKQPWSVFLVATLLVALSPAAAAFKCMPVYGNWCGIQYPPGFPASGIMPPPIDAFDAACMRHDICALGHGSDTTCDRQFVVELRSLAVQLGYLPRPLRWAEYVIRVKAGGPWDGMPMPSPGDALGLMSALAAPCW